MVRENLADITAKANAQQTMAGVLGMLCGIALSKALGTGVAEILPVFAVLSCLHMAAVTRSLRTIKVPTLSLQRTERLALQYIGIADRPGLLMTPAELAQHENFVLPYRSPLQASTTVVGPPLHRLVQSLSLMQTLLDMQGPYPKYVCAGSTGSESYQG